MLAPRIFGILAMAAALVVVLSACAQQVSTPDVRSLIVACLEQGAELPKLMALAEAGARGDEYAAEAEKIAQACRQSRIAIERVEGASPCARLTAASESMAWAISKQFTTGREPSVDPLVGLEAAMTACSATLPPDKK